MTAHPRVYVFDPTALVLLFAAHQPVFEVYRTAAAIGEANIQVQATEGDWEAVLLSPQVDVLDLTASAVLAASAGPTLGMGHAMCEAERVHGIVVTGRAVNVYDRLKLSPAQAF